MDLCGHTHDGQMFPGNILVAMMWENSCGYLNVDGMHNIVTSGVGVFGPGYAGWNQGGDMSDNGEF